MGLPPGVFKTPASAISPPEPDTPNMSSRAFPRIAGVVAATFQRMSPCFVRAALLGLVLVAPLPGQLPYLSAPPGSLRLEFGGAFRPTSWEYHDGVARRLGDPLGETDPLAADVAARTAPLLGRPATPGRIGTLRGDVMQQRGDGLLALAVGVSRRLTVGARAPIVSVRTEWRLAHDPATATLGRNPALLGDPASSAFVTQFGTALDLLRQRRDAGAYAGDPSLQALADATLNDAPAWRALAAALLVDAGTAAAVLPLADSPDGLALLAAATTWRDQLSGPLGIEGFTALPALPVTALSTQQFGELLGAPDGFALISTDEPPLVGLGDVELTATWMLRNGGDSLGRRWNGAWLVGGVTLPTGTPPRHDRLRDAGTGDGQTDIHLGAVLELGAGRLGLRAEGSHRLQLPGSRTVRVAPRDQFLVPIALLRTVDWNPGDVTMLTARPFFRVADRLAATASATWWRRGGDQWSTAVAADAAAVAAMGEGTAASALLVGAGLAYAHGGQHLDGVARMPVEAGLSVERTVWSGSGLVPRELVARLYFRVYKRLW